MTEDEATNLGILPSERVRYFKLVDAKTNFTLKSLDNPWYRLHSVALPNAEPPIYPNGDNVQAVVRVTLPLPKTASEMADDRKIQKAILDLVDHGKLINGERYPYSPNVTGHQNMRALLDDALTAVADATQSRQWPPGDLRAVVHAAIDKMRGIGWLYEKKIEKGRFHGSAALHVEWRNTPWSKQASSAPEEEPADGDELDNGLAELLEQKIDKE
jgi:hypothetical protein